MQYSRFVGRMQGIGQRNRDLEELVEAQPLGRDNGSASWSPSPRPSTNRRSDDTSTTNATILISAPQYRHNNGST